MVAISSCSMRRQSPNSTNQCDRPTVRQRVHLHGGYHHASCLLDRNCIQSGAARFLPRDPIAGHGIQRRVLIGPSTAPSAASCSTVTSHPTQTVATAAFRDAALQRDGSLTLRGRLPYVELGRWRPWRTRAAAGGNRRFLGRVANAVGVLVDLVPESRRAIPGPCASAGSSSGAASWPLGKLPPTSLRSAGLRNT